MGNNSPRLPYFVVIPAKAGIQGLQGRGGCPWTPAFEGVTQSRFWRDVSPGGMLNLGVYTKVQYLPTWIGPSIAWMGMALLMRPAAVMRLPASPLLLPRQCGDAACWPSTG